MRAMAFLITRLVWEPISVLGGEVYATDNLSIGLEVKYNIIKDFDQAMLGVRVGYSF